MTARRDELLDATVSYLLKNGVGDLSLRPLAEAIGSKARLLIYHFGTRDALVSSALAVALGRMQQEFLEMLRGATLDRALLAFWRFATDADTEPYLRLFFEVHGLATRNDVYREYLAEAIESWKAIVVQRLDRRLPRRRREELATLVIAVVDGLLLDYIATGDRERNTRALTQFTKQLTRRER